MAESSACCFLSPCPTQIYETAAEKYVALVKYKYKTYWNCQTKVVWASTTEYCPLESYLGRRRIDEGTVYGSSKVMDTREKHSAWMFQRFSHKYIYDIQSGHVQKKNGHISSRRIILQIKNISKIFLIFSGSGSCCILSGSHCPPNPLNFCSLWKPHLLIV